MRFERLGEETRVGHVARHGFPEAETLRQVGAWWRASLDALKGRMER